MTTGYFDAVTLAKVASGDLTPRLFVKCAFLEGASGYHMDSGAIPIDGVTYHGECAFEPLESLPGVSDLSMPELTIRFSAADPQIQYDFRVKTWHLRPVTISLLLFDETLATVYPTPLRKIKGLMDTVKYPESLGSEASLDLSIVDLLTRSVVSAAAYRTDGDQRQRLATDSIFRGVAKVDDGADTYWAKRIPSYGNALVRGLPPSKPG